MSFFQTLQDATQEQRETLFNLPIIRQAMAGQVSLESYRAFLTQAYYHVRHTVPVDDGLRREAAVAHGMAARGRL